MTAMQDVFIMYTYLYTLCLRLTVILVIVLCRLLLEETDELYMYLDYNTVFTAKNRDRCACAQS